MAQRFVRFPSSLLHLCWSFSELSMLNNSLDISPSPNFANFIPSNRKNTNHKNIFPNQRRPIAFWKNVWNSIRFWGVTRNPKENWSIFDRSTNTTPINSSQLHWIHSICHRTCRKVRMNLRTRVDIRLVIRYHCFSPFSFSIECRRWSFLSSLSCSVYEIDELVEGFKSLKLNNPQPDLMTNVDPLFGVPLDASESTTPTATPRNRRHSFTFSRDLFVNKLCSSSSSRLFL